MTEHDASSRDDPPDEGTFLRPEAHVLPRSALVPDENVVRPAPTQFTHELAVDTPFQWDRDPGRIEPDGVLAAGTRVVVAATDGDRSRVVDGRGLAVDVPQANLREIPR